MRKLMKFIVTSMIFCTFFSYEISLFTTKKENILYQKAYTGVNSDFAAKIAGLAIADMNQTGVYASVTIAQAIIESTNGTSSLAAKYNNYFGMVAGSKGSIKVNGNSVSCTSNLVGTVMNSDASNQFWSGAAVCLNTPNDAIKHSWFRVYDGIGNSFGDHSRNFWCHSDGRYIKNGVFAASDPKEQLQAIANSGYAEATSYAQTLYNNYIVPNNLTKYDSSYSSGTKPAYAETCTNAEYEGKPIEVDETPEVEEVEIDVGEMEELEHYTTSYGGLLTEGWIYNRLKATEEWKEFDIEINEQDIDDSIDEIFDRAKLSYEAYVEEYGLPILEGPGLSAADANGYLTRINMPSFNGEGSDFYFSNQNLSYAGGYLGQCTWYAFGRANEILSAANSDLKWNIASNAGLWYDQNLARGISGFKSSNDYTQPKAGAIISWKKAGAPGHVAVVESVNGNNVTISEANIGSAKSSSNPYGWQSVTLSTSEINRRWGNYTFSGYIYTVE